MSEITVESLRSKVDEFLNLKALIKNHEQAIKDINEKLTPVSFELQEIMEAMELDRFEGRLGKVTRVVTDYVATPQSEDEKKAFHQFLKDEGLYEEMVSVNFQRLNSFYKDRLTQAIEEGRELSIPGLEPKQRVEIRKSR